MTDAPAYESRRFRVPEAEKDLRLDIFLASSCEDISRSRLKKLIEKGRVTVDGLPVTHASRRISGGAKIELHLEPLAPPALEPEDIPLTFLYEDEHIVVVDKPAGLVVHPGAGHRHGTLIHAVLARTTLRFPEITERAGLVHRLDKDTSGVLLVTKHPDALDRYSALFAERRTDKRYLAIVRGNPRDDHGHLDTLYGRHTFNRVKFSSKVAKGKRAVTDWRVLSRGRLATLLEVTIHTGRTHQIRVHLADLGHPVIGDLLYGQALPRPQRPAGLSEFEAIFRMSRQALHARSLAFVDPYSGRRRVFQAPVPPDMAAVCAALGVDVTKIPDAE